MGKGKTARERAEAGAQGADGREHTANAPEQRSCAGAAGRGGPGASARGPGPRPVPSEQGRKPPHQRRASGSASEGMPRGCTAAMLAPSGAASRGEGSGLRHSPPPGCSLIIDHPEDIKSKSVRTLRTRRGTKEGRLTSAKRPAILAEGARVRSSDTEICAR